MTNFKRTQLTAKGKVLAAKSGIDIEFTKIETGCGIYTADEEIETLTELKNKVQTFEINSVSRKTDILVKLTFAISNQSLREAYLLTEIGVYANDPDDGEILYAICYAIPEDAQKILCYNGEFVSTISVSMNITVSGKSNVTFLASGGYVLQEDLQEYVRDVSFDKDTSAILVEKGNGGIENIPVSSGAYVVANTAPAEINKLWIDTANGGVTKYYDGTSWVPTAAVWS